MKAQYKSEYYTYESELNENSVFLHLFFSACDLKGLSAAESSMHCAP